MVVILCVVQATVDFSTAAAIKLARKHDPEGERTMVGMCSQLEGNEGCMHAYVSHAYAPSA